MIFVKFAPRKKAVYSSIHSNILLVLLNIFILAAKDLNLFIRVYTLKLISSESALFIFTCLQEVLQDHNKFERDSKYKYMYDAIFSFSKESSYEVLI